MKKKVKVTQEYINQIKSDRDRLRKERDELQEDLNKHRNYYVGLLRWAIKANGNGQGLRSDSLIEDLGKHLNKVKSWYWG